MAKISYKHDNTELIDALKKELLRRAEERFPGAALGTVGEKAHLSECYTIDTMGPDFNLLMFWYNIGKNTHAESVVFDYGTLEELTNGGADYVRGKKD
jgi:hypothetical protein